jgi:hypothetical protein
MNTKASERLAGIQFQPVKAELRRGEVPVRHLNSAAGDVLEQARGNVQLEVKQMAGEMGISHSLVARGLHSADDLGFHRLWELSDAFWLQLVIAIVQKRKLMTVETTLRLTA